MTLVVAAMTPESIWLAADRRLSYPNRVPKDDARKAMILETDDGVAILGYAGLGETALGTEPADWMSAVLRGRRLSLEQSLQILADACKKQIPQHLVRLAGQAGAAHTIFVPAFVNDEVSLYSIDLVTSSDRQQCYFRHTRYVVERPLVTKPRPPRVAVAGSGARYLSGDRRWMRTLLRILKAYDRGKISAETVAKHFAALNQEVSSKLKDETVGPRCVVVWRNKKGGVHRGGGGHQFYTGTTCDIRTVGSTELPIIATGMDIRALSKVLLDYWVPKFEAVLKDQSPLPQPDQDELNAQLALLPDKPDETLH
jgi:hypothetical protein